MPGDKTVSRRTQKVVKKIMRKYRRKHRGLPKNSVGTSGLTIRGPMKATSQFNPFPRRWVCKMRYCDTLTLSSGTSGVFGSTVKFALNDIYDPYQLTGGHSAYGLNQMSALYKNYIVRGCMIEIVFTDPTQDGLVAGCLVQGHGGAGTMAGITVDYIKEQPYSWTVAMNNTGSQVYKFKQYFPVNVIEGLSKTQYECALNDYTALTNSSPAFIPFIEIAVASDRATSGQSIVCRVLLTYYTEFFQPILQAHS